MDYEMNETNENEEEVEMENQKSENKGLFGLAIGAAVAGAIAGGAWLVKKVTKKKKYGESQPNRTVEIVCDDELESDDE